MSLLRILTWFTVGLVIFNFFHATSTGILMSGVLVLLVLLFDASIWTGRDDKSMKKLDKKLESRHPSFWLAYMGWISPCLYIFMGDAKTVFISTINMKKDALLMIASLFIIVTIIMFLLYMFWYRTTATSFLMALMICFIIFSSEMYSMNILLDKDYSIEKTTITNDRIRGNVFWYTIDVMTENGENETIRRRNPAFIMVDEFDEGDTLVVRNGKGAFGISYKNMFVRIERR